MAIEIREFSHETWLAMFFYQRVSFMQLVESIRPQTIIMQNDFTIGELQAKISGFCGVTSMEYTHSKSHEKKEQNITFWQNRQSSKRRSRAEDWNFRVMIPQPNCWRFPSSLVGSVNPVVCWALLVIHNIAIENGDLMFKFTHWTWWFFDMFVY